MKALFAALDVHSGTGGMQQYCRRVVRALAEAGCRPTVVALRDGEVPESRTPEGARVVGCRRSRRKMAAAFASALVREEPDVVILSHTLLAPMALIARTLRPQARIVLLAYGIDVWTPPSRARAAMIDRLVHRVVAISRTTAGRMAEAYGLPPSRFAIVPPAVEAPVTGAAHPERPGIQRLLTVARLDAADRSKGVDRVVRALPLVLADFPDVHYIVAGDGSLRGEIERLASSLGVAGRVHLLGRVEDEALDALYRGSDAFVMPSRKEGFGIVYLEAWRAGLPVIAGDRDAGAEVVQDGVTGLLVEVESTESIAAAIKRILGDPELRRSLGEAGRAVVAERYTHDRFRASFVAALEGAR